MQSTEGEIWHLHTHGKGNSQEDENLPTYHSAVTRALPELAQKGHIYDVPFHSRRCPPDGGPTNRITILGGFIKNANVNAASIPA